MTENAMVVSAKGVRLLILLAAAVLLQTAAPAEAAKPAGETRKLPRGHISKKLGEPSAILQREAWFYRPRQAGAEGSMAEMRAQAVEVAKLATRDTDCARDQSTQSWTCRGPSSSDFGGWAFGKVSGRIPALAKDWTSGALYVGSASGGLWKSLDDGASWIPLFDGVGTQTIGAIAVDPNNPATLWVGTGENTTYWCEDYFGMGLLRSTDGGLTWEAKNGSGSGTLENLSVFCSVSVDPRDSSNLVVGGMTSNCESGTYSRGGIYSTTDAGATWTRRLQGYVTSVVRDPNSADVLWAGVYYGGAFKSTDNGATWTAQTAGGIPTGNNARRTEVAVSPSDSKTVYALFQSNVAADRPELWRTTDGGATWSLRASGTAACDGQCSYNMTLRVHRSNPDILYRGTIQLFKSTNGGTSWTNLTGDWGSRQKVHQDTHFLLMNPANSDEFYIGCDGGIWKTTNGGAGFTNLNSNLNLTQFYDVGIHPTDDDIIIGGAQDNSSLARTSGDTWELQDVTGDGFVGLINPSDPNVVYIASYPWDIGGGAVYPGVLRSSGGVLGSFLDWVTGPGSGITPTGRIGWVTPYTLVPSSPSTLFLGTDRAYKSMNGGDTWAPVGPEDMTSGGPYETVNTITVSRADGNVVYAGTTDSRIWRTLDGGTTWGEISSGLPARQINDIAPDPSAPATAFCAVSGFNTAHLYEFAGSGWTARGTGLPEVPANTVVALSGTEIYVGTDLGVYRSLDRGQHFSPFGAGLPEGLVVTDLEYNPTTNTLTAGTYGRGAWQVNLEPSGALSAEASAEPSTGGAPLAVTFTANAAGGTPPYTFSWAFGDGGSGAGQTAGHTYAEVGKYTATVTVSDSTSGTATATASVSATPPPPTVSGVAALANPLRLKVTGAGFKAGCSVNIDGVAAPSTSFKGADRVVAKGSSLKTMVPKGRQVNITVRNSDGGESAPFVFTR